jgi:hypothetical protein
MKQLPEIKVEIERLAKLIDAHDSELPTYGASEQSGRPHIEVDNHGYHYVVAERGHELSRLTTQELDRLLYAAFKSVTSQLSFKYEVRHRVEEQDSRRAAFQRQIALLSALPNNWAERRSTEISEILQDHPFDDNSGPRATLSRQLREQGLSPEEIWQIAREKYPAPERWTLDSTGRMKREPENAT